jgi:hypothetical protein
MSTPAKDIIKKFKAFNNEIVSLVENASGEAWDRITEAEQWPAGVTARHIAAGHYMIIDLAGMIVRGEKLPEWTMEKIFEMSNQHARDHAGCTREEVLDLLQTNSTSFIEFVEKLSDEDLDRKSYFAATEGEVSTEQLMEFVVFQSAREHLDSFKKTVSAG